MNKIRLAKQIRWHKIGLWDSPPFSDFLITDALINSKQFGFKEHQAVMYLHGETFVGSADFDHFYNFYKKAYNKNGFKEFNFLGKQITRAARLAISQTDRLKSKDFSKSSAEELQKHFSEFQKCIRPSIVLGFILQPVEKLFKEILEKELYAFLQNKTETEKNQIIAKLTVPVREALMTKENKDLLRLATKISKIKKFAIIWQKNNASKIEELLKIKYPEIYSAFKKHAEEYSWMSNFNWHDSPTALKTYSGNLKKIIKSGTANKEIEKIQKQKKQIETEYQELLDQIYSERNLKIKKITDKIREFVNLKMENWEPVAIAGNNCLGLFQAIADKINVPMRIFWLMTPEEINAVLSEKSVKKIKIRRGFVAAGKKIYILNPAEVEELKKFLKPRSAKIIKGLVVYPGRACGEVIKIMTVKEISKMKKRAVLACPMTNPDYMPAIRMAAAIVTDQGGLLCHAAIVSREFKIPCIVGTRFATHVLSDGDVVEVDAEKGIVRIIKKSLE